MTGPEALENCIRILQHAEMETNLPLGEHLLSVAAGWLEVAEALVEHAELET